MIIVCLRCCCARLRFWNPGSRPHDAVDTGMGRLYGAGSGGASLDDDCDLCGCCCCCSSCCCPGCPLRPDRGAGDDGAGGYDARPWDDTTETSPLARLACLLRLDGDSRPCALPRSELDPPCARVGDELCDRCPWLPLPRTPNCCIMKGAAGGRRGMSA